MDPIANMLSTIKNAAMVGKTHVEITHSKGREDVAKVLEKAGFIAGVKTFKEKGKSYKSMRIDLSKEEQEIRIKQIKRISKPGRRIYQKYNKIEKLNPQYGVIVVSTPSGVMSGEQARKKKVGGEVICKVT